MHIDRLARLGIVASLALVAAAASARTPGIGKDEIVLGSILDRSGPVAGYGEDVRRGLLMGVADFNGQGGAHGRKLRLLDMDGLYAVTTAQQDSLGEVPGDIFGNPPMRFSPTQHLGSNRSRLSQLQGGRWRIVLDYDQMQ